MSLDVEDETGVLNLNNDLSSIQCVVCGQPEHQHLGTREERKWVVCHSCSRHAIKGCLKLINDLPTSQYYFKCRECCTHHRREERYLLWIMRGGMEEMVGEVVEKVLAKRGHAEQTRLANTLRVAEEEMESERKAAKEREKKLKQELSEVTRQAEADIAMCHGELTRLKDEKRAEKHEKKIAIEARKEAEDEVARLKALTTEDDPERNMRSNLEKQIQLLRQGLQKSEESCDILQDRAKRTEEERVKIEQELREMKKRGEEDRAINKDLERQVCADEKQEEKLEAERVARRELRKQLDDAQDQHKAEVNKLKQEVSKLQEEIHRGEVRRQKEAEIAKSIAKEKELAQKVQEESRQKEKEQKEMQEYRRELEDLKKQNERIMSRRRELGETMQKGKGATHKKEEEHSYSKHQTAHADKARRKSQEGGRRSGERRGLSHEKEGRRSTERGGAQHMSRTMTAKKQEAGTPVHILPGGQRGIGIPHHIAHV